jgi:hypothetical protein
MCAPWRNACRADAASSYTPSWPCLYALGHPVCCSFLNCFRSRAACCFTSAAHDQPLGVSHPAALLAGLCSRRSTSQASRRFHTDRRFRWHLPRSRSRSCHFADAAGSEPDLSACVWPTQSEGLRRQQHTGGAPIETSRSDISHMRVELNASWICLPIRLADRAIPHTPLTASSRSAGHSGVQSISAQR